MVEQSYHNKDNLDSQEDTICPDCNRNLIFMEERKKFWCPACGSSKVPLMDTDVEEAPVQRGRERIIHGHFEEEKLKDANPIAFYGVIGLVLVATILLFWFSYVHNSLGVPNEFQGNAVYPGIGEVIDTPAGYVGWIVMILGLAVIGALLWFRDPSSRTEEAEKSHKFFRYGVLASMIGMGAFSFSSLLWGQYVEDQNRGIEGSSIFLAALIPGIIVFLGGVGLFVYSHKIGKESDFRESRSLYFEDIDLVLHGDCPECGFPTILTSNGCDNCDLELADVDFALVREEILQDRRTLEEPLFEDGEPVIVSKSPSSQKIEEEYDEMEIAEIPEAGKVEPGYEVVDEIIEQEILEGMSSESEISEEELADEIVEQTVISEMTDEAPAKLPKVCDMCAGELSFIDEYDAWYCYDCEKYEGE